MSLAVRCIPRRAVDGALASITAQYILKIQNLQRPGTETISMKYLAVLADWCSSWTLLLLSFLALYELLRLFWMLTDSFDNLRKLQKCLAGRSSNLLEAGPELYSIYFGITCSHTFTSSFRILSNENVWVNNLLFFYNTLYDQSCPDFFKYLDLVVSFTWVVNWNVKRCLTLRDQSQSYHWKCRGHVLWICAQNLEGVYILHFNNILQDPFSVSLDSVYLNLTTFMPTKNK